VTEGLVVLLAWIEYTVLVLILAYFVLWRR